MFAILALLLAVAFIWGNSMIPGKISMEWSNRLVAALGGTVTHSLQEEREATTFLTSASLRKMAHMAEFAALGALAAALVPLNRKRWTGVLLTGLGAAVLDETIQLFRSRTSSVRDIWIDMAGFLCGVALGALAHRLYGKRKRRKAP